MLMAISEEKFFLTQKRKTRLHTKIETIKAHAGNATFAIVSLIIGLIILAIPMSVNAGVWPFESCYEVGSARPQNEAGSGLESMLKLGASPNSPDGKYGLAGATYSWYNVEGNDKWKKRGNDLGDIDFKGDKTAPNGDCGNFWDNFGPGFGTGLNNFISGINHLIYQFTVWLFQNAYNNNIGDMIIDIILGPIELMRSNLYLSAFGIVLMLVAVYVILMAGRKRFHQAFGGAAWAIFMAIVFALLLWNPRFIPDLSNEIIKTANNAILSIASSSNGIAYCDGAAITPIAEQKESKIGAVDTSAVAKGTCAMWSTFIFSPWSAGQFGKQPSELVTINGHAVPSTPQLAIGNNPKGSNWALYQYAVQTKQPGGEDKSSEAQQKAFGNIIDAVHTPGGGGDSVDKPLWTGHDPGKQFVMTLMGLLSVLLGAWLIGSISVKVLVYGVMLHVMIFLLPVVGLVAPHPTVGKKSVIKYLGQCANFVVKSIGLTLALMLVLVVFMGVSSKTSSGELGWWYSIFILIIFAFATQKIISMLENLVSFGGGGVGGGGSGGSSVRRAAGSAGKLAAVGAVGTVAGLAAGARLSPLGKAGRESKNHAREEILRSKGRDAQGHKIETEEEKQKKAAEKKEFDKKLEKDGLTMGEDGIIKDKDGNVDKRNWIKDEEGQAHAPNSDYAKKQAEKQRRIEAHEANKHLKAANRQAIAGQFLRSASGAGSAARAAALGVAAGRGGLRGSARGIKDAVRGRGVDQIAQAQRDRATRKANSKIDRRARIENEGKLPERLSHKFEAAKARRGENKANREEYRNNKKERKNKRREERDNRKENDYKTTGRVDPTGGSGPSRSTGGRGPRTSPPPRPNGSGSGNRGSRTSPPIPNTTTGGSSSGTASPPPAPNGSRTSGGPTRSSSPNGSTGGGGRSKPTSPNRGGSSKGSNTPPTPPVNPNGSSSGRKRRRSTLL